MSDKRKTYIAPEPIERGPRHSAGMTMYERVVVTVVLILGTGSAVGLGILIGAAL